MWYPYRNIYFTVWDVARQRNLRQLYRPCYTNTEGILIVIDSNDVRRINAVKNELHALTNDEESLKDTQLLVLVNKQRSFECN